MKKINFEAKYGPDSLMIPRIILQDKRLRPIDPIIYSIIWWFFSRKGYCKATSAVMAATCQVTQRTIRASTLRLKKLNYIEIKGSIHESSRLIIPKIVIKNSKNGSIPRCEYCGEEDESRLTYDHIIPKKSGGKNSSENLILACMPCNSWKRAKTLQEFLENNKI